MIDHSGHEVHADDDPLYAEQVPMNAIIELKAREGIIVIAKDNIIGYQILDPMVRISAHKGYFLLLCKYNRNEFVYDSELDKVKAVLLQG